MFVFKSQLTFWPPNHWLQITAQSLKTKFLVANESIITHVVAKESSVVCTKTYVCQPELTCNCHGEGGGHSQHSYRIIQG